MKTTTFFNGKKLLTGLALVISAFGFTQNPRMVLIEEFTGENCGSCYLANPAFDAVVKNNAAKCICIKWMVPIPTAPSNPKSLYQENLAEINNRWMSYYTNITGAPQCKMDGQDLTVFGTSGQFPNNPYYVDNTVINNAYSVTTPFKLNTNLTWDYNYGNAAITVTVTTTSPISSAGNLKLRLCLVEREILFPNPPGLNGEMDFYNPVRKSYPDISNATSLLSNWATNQTATFTINCAIPSYIHDKSQIAFVAFVQDDGNQKIMQAAMTNTTVIANDVEAVSINNVNNLICGNTVWPSVTVKNLSNSTILSMTVNPYVDGIPATPVVWQGNLNPAVTTSVVLNSTTPSVGFHTYSVNISNVMGVGMSGGSGDYNPQNNNKATEFSIINSYASPPIAETFSTTSFPPPGWFKFNPDGGAVTWDYEPSTGGYGNSAGCAKYNFLWNTNKGDMDDLYLPPMNFSNISNPVMTFDYAYAQYMQNINNDIVEIRVSTNCGVNWTTVYMKQGNSFATAPANYNNWLPLSTEWKTENVNLSAFAGQSNVLVKFTITNDRGNCLYLDNVNIANLLGVAVDNETFNTLELFPNPAQSETNLRINSKTNDNGSFRIMNSIGQIVVTKEVELKEGYNTVNLDLNDLSSGYYTIIWDHKQGSVTKKLIISK